ncbi:hypothetical protein SNE40_019208 [Patella caerulea]|uniref:BRICHOS domain-containing protein n=1 Tax=Patella caerulea TaxID=87958 RepID=A0AAN8J671_PATCE
MAPPKVDLNGKEKPTDVPVAVVVDQSTESHKNANLREVNRRRKRCRAAAVVLVLGVVIIGVALAIMVFAHRRHRNFGRWGFCGTKDKPYRIHENVHIDNDKHLIYVNNTRTGEFGASHAIHDYRKKMSAYRDPEHKRCFIEPLSREFDEGIHAWGRDDDDEEKPQRYYRAEPPTSPDDARRMWGDNIADHCRGHKFHTLTLSPHKPTTPKTTEHVIIIIKIVSVDAIRVITIDIHQN